MDAAAPKVGLLLGSSLRSIFSAWLALVELLREWDECYRLWRRCDAEEMGPLSRFLIP